MKEGVHIGIRSPWIPLNWKYKGCSIVKIARFLIQLLVLSTRHFSHQIFPRQSQRPVFAVPVVADNIHGENSDSGKQKEQVVRIPVHNRHCLVFENVVILHLDSVKRARGMRACIIRQMANKVMGEPGKNWSKRVSSQVVRGNGPVKSACHLAALG